MGSRSRSSSSQSSTNQQFSQVNDGEFAGASGVTIDESDNSIEDSYNTENNYELETNWEQDNSIDDSYNTEIDIEMDGDYAGNSGTIQITDGNIVEEGFEFGSEALNGAFGFGEEALNVVDNTVDRAFEYGEYVANQATNLSRDALAANESVSARAFNFGADSIDMVERSTARNLDAITDITETQTNAFTDTLEEITLANSGSLNDIAGSVLAQNAAQSTEQLEAVAELARNTSLQGQDIVAQSANEQVKYMMFAFVGLAAFGIFLTAKKG